MIIRDGHPWLWSLGLHLLLGGVGLTLILQEPPAAQPPLRMRLVQTNVPAATTESRPLPAVPSWTGAGPAPSSAAEPAAPGWQGPATQVGPLSAVIPAPVSLDELWPAESPEPDQPTSDTSTGWTLTSGEAYTPPPLPPPGLTPPQGARWNLSLTIPGAGGLALTIDGLDSGYPELDRWLESYLRTVSFPAGLDGQDYRIRWSLRLETGRPQ